MAIPEINQSVIAIVDKAMADLQALGAEHRNAASILVIQGLCRLGEDLAQLREIERFVADAIEAFTGEGETLQ